MDRPRFHLHRAPRAAGHARLTAAVRLAACLTLLPLAGCVATEPQAEVEFRYHDLSGGVAPASLLSVHMDDGGAQRSMSLGGGLTTDDGVSAVSPRYRTRTRGTLTIDVALRRTTLDTLAVGRVTLPLRADWRWTVQLLVAPTGQPLENCGDCRGRSAFPLRASPSDATPDTLYVVWGGTSISGPVVY